MFHKLIVVTFAALALAACEQPGQKQFGGTVLGGAAGALAGSQFGGGKGQLAAVAAGTLIGALIGSEVGKSLDRADQAAMGQAATTARTAPIGQTITWNNPDSGNYGTVTPTKDGTRADGAYCREFQQTVTVGGKTEEAYGTACRQPDGSWKIVN
jgi:surface antigen